MSRRVGYTASCTSVHAQQLSVAPFSVNRQVGTSFSAVCKAEAFVEMWYIPWGDQVKPTYGTRSAGYNCKGRTRVSHALMTSREQHGRHNRERASEKTGSTRLGEQGRCVNSSSNSKRHGSIAFITWPISGGTSPQEPSLLAPPWPAHGTRRAAPAVLLRAGLCGAEHTTVNPR